MKNIVILILGVALGLGYSQYEKAQNNIEIYGARNVQTELKANIDRVNLVLDSVEKKYIQKNVPKPDIPKPDLGCKCNGAGTITQPDGNKIQCQCSKDGGTCQCKPKQEPQIVQPQAQSPHVQYIPVTP
jgi:hypothetical protein